jgi:hypothetical protein
LLSDSLAVTWNKVAIMMFIDGVCVSCPQKADGADSGACAIVLDEYGNIIELNG